MGGAQPAATQAPESAEVTAHRLRLGAIVLGALVLVLVGLSVLIGIAARQPFDGVVLAGVLAAVLGWLIIRRQLTTAGAGSAGPARPETGSQARIGHTGQRN